MTHNIAFATHLDALADAREAYAVAKQRWFEALREDRKERADELESLMNEYARREQDVRDTLMDWHARVYQPVAQHIRVTDLRTGPWQEGR
jgi:hypothetical protein